MVVVDDVATTGGSLVDAVTCLRKKGVKVKSVIVLVDRNEGAREKLKKPCRVTRDCRLLTETPPLCIIPVRILVRPREIIHQSGPAYHPWLWNSTPSRQRSERRTSKEWSESVLVLVLANLSLPPSAPSLIAPLSPLL